MTIKFLAKTPEAFCIKGITEILSSTLKTICFEIDATGIYLSMTDSNTNILFKIELLAENFHIYKFLYPQTLHIGINSAHLFKMIRSVKKKDSLTLYIDEDNHPNDLIIAVTPKGASEPLQISYVTIHRVQNIKVNPPPITSKPIIIQSSEYHKVVKEMCNMANTITINAFDYHTVFASDTASVMKRRVTFGDKSSSAAVVNETNQFKEVFYSAYVNKTPKLATFSPTIQMFPGKPILFRTNVGTLGKISIYIKTREQIDKKSAATATATATATTQVGSAAAAASGNREDDEDDDDDDDDNLLPLPVAVAPASAASASAAYYHHHHTSSSS
jgi:hypothetical protein